MVGENINGHTYWYSYTHTVRGVRCTIYEDDISIETHDVADADAAYQTFREFIDNKKFIAGKSLA